MNGRMKAILKLALTFGEYQVALYTTGVPAYDEMAQTVPVRIETPCI